MLQIQIDGVPELLAKLEEAKSKKIQLKALRTGAYIIADAVRQRAPIRADGSVWNESKTTALPPGALKNDVRVITLRKTDKATVLVTFGKYTKHVARLVEFGHKLVFRGKERGMVRSQPFFRPAVEGSLQFARTAIAASFKEQLAKINKGGKAGQ